MSLIGTFRQWREMRRQLRLSMDEWNTARRAAIALLGQCEETRTRKERTGAMVHTTSTYVDHCRLARGHEGEHWY